jgi:hypothetical protein
MIRKNLLFVLVAVLLAGMILSTASAGDSIPKRPCTCEVSIDLNLDGICDVCGLHIPGDGIPRGDGIPDGDGEPDKNKDQNKDGSCED